MKIEKKKIINSSRLSSTTKAGIASMLGMSAVLMSGCLGEAESGQVIGPVEPDNNNPNSSDDSEGPEIASSSSVADIPLSHEHLSSEVVEALSSSSVQTPSSSSYEPIIEAGILPPYEESSSSVAPLSSSEEEPIMLSGDIAPYEDPTSSSVEAASSSSKVQSSSSRLEVQIEPVNPDTINKKRIIEPIFCEENDPSCYNIRLCKDPEGCMIYSMVTTFEQDDVQA